MQGVNWVVAQRLDHLAASGLPTPVTPAPSQLWQQFPVACNLTTQGAGAHEKVIAYRGYLRAAAGRAGIIHADQAKAYFGSGGRSYSLDACRSRLPEGSSHSNSPLERSSPQIAEEDLYGLTPYSRWWQYYKTPAMVGNAYLWYPRKSHATLSMRKFAWHAGAGVPRGGGAGAFFEGDSCFSNETLYLRDGVQRSFGGAGVARIDVKDPALACRNVPPPAQLPLSRDAAERLVNVLHELTRT